MITHEQRRQWCRRVLRSELTAAQKTVLLALETYSDYGNGGSAHPGEERLAEDCDLTPRAVRTALDRGWREFGLIERTAPANPKAGRAAVYRIVASATTTGTAVPVNNSTTGTVVPLVRPTTGTAVPVNNSTTGTATSPPPERPFLPPESFTRTTGVVTNSGTSPEQFHPAHTPSRFCDEHPHGYRGKCGPCGNARTAFDAWQAAAAERDVEIATADDFARRRRRQLIDSCPDCCDTKGWISADPDGTPNRLGDHSTRCEHPHLRMAEHA